MSTQKEETVKMVAALKASKISVSKIESELGFSNGLIGKAVKGELELSEQKFELLVVFFKEKIVVNEQKQTETTSVINELKGIVGNETIVKKKNEEEGIHPFDVLLRKFNKLIDNAPSVNSVKKELNEISELAKQNHILNFWQKDAILKRCDNYINGSYCSTSKLNQI